MKEQLLEKVVREEIRRHLKSALLCEFQEVSIDYGKDEEKSKALLTLIKHIHLQDGLTPEDSDTYDRLVSFLYKIITGLFGSQQSRKHIRNPEHEEIRAIWNDFFSTSEYWGADKHWAVRQYNWEALDDIPHLSNIYVTLDKAPENLMQFMRSIHILDKTLHKISNKTKMPISFKTHKDWALLITHNDSLKIYFTDERQRRFLLDTIGEWYRQNRISTSARTHHNGYDVFNGPEKSSFGQLVAKKMAKEIIKFVRDNIHAPPENICVGISNGFERWVARNAEDLIFKFQYS
jgi:hypothetical protein